MATLQQERTPKTNEEIHDIILAAVTVAGERFEDESTKEWQERVGEHAKEILLLTNERSPLFRKVRQLDSSRPLVAEIDSVKKEAKSGRALVAYTPVKASKHNQDMHQETTRTEFLNTDDGLEMARLAKSLIGHRTMIYKETEIQENGNKASVIRHIVDLGLPDDD